LEAPHGEDRQKKSVSPENDDFVVTESTQTGAPELIGMESNHEGTSSAEDKLEIRSSASMLDSDVKEQEALQETKREFIGDQKPPIPGFVDTEPLKSTPNSADDPGSQQKEKPEFKKLSQQELADIRKNLYQESEKSRKSPVVGSSFEDSSHNKDVFMGSRDKHSDSAASTDRIEPVRSIEDPAQTGGIQRAHRVKGVAYFKGNFVQLVGNPFLHTGDEITVNDKQYLLKPKTLSRRFLTTVAAACFLVILIIVGLQFINTGSSGKGEIVGMILSNGGQPYLEGARITVPSLSKTTTSNSQGFFHLELIPTGSYELTYELADNSLGKANVTVMSGQTTIMSFGGSRQIPSTPNIRSDISPLPASIANRQVIEEKRIDQPDSKPKNQSEFGSIEFVSNVDGARFLVDDKTVGSGKGISAKVKPGNHQIKVSKSGYSDYTSEIDLAANQSVTVNGVLQPLPKDVVTAAAVDDHISRGNQALTSGNFQKAIEEFTAVLSLQPSNKDGYQRRGEAYIKAGQTDKAVGDYVRLGEICRLGKLNDQAINAFSTALKYDSKNKVALVGRAGARLDNGDYSPALRDFESALKVDDQFYPALFGAAVSQFKLGNNKQADKHFKNAYKLNQSDPYLYQYMMLNYLALDDVKKLRKVYADYKAIASSQELAELKSSSRFASIIRLLEDENQ